MADYINVELPAGWTKMISVLNFNNSRVGRPGRWKIVQNDDYATWQVRVSYLRSEFETQSSLRIDDLIAFFLSTRAAYAFPVTVIDNQAHNDYNGSGVVLLLNGVYRLFKRYTLGSISYDHPITRPTSPIVLGGGAAGGVVNTATGIVTGISAAGSWTGGFRLPMIFPENGLQITRSPDGTVEAVDILLEENLEI